MTKKWSDISGSLANPDAEAGATRADEQGLTAEELELRAEERALRAEVQALYGDPVQAALAIDEIECCICMDNYQPDSLVIQLKCHPTHVYHLECFAKFIEGVSEDIG